MVLSNSSVGVFRPINISSYILATRSGVSLSPALSGSSPTPSSMSLIPFSIFFKSLLYFRLLPLLEYLQLLYPRDLNLFQKNLHTFHMQDRQGQAQLSLPSLSHL